MELASWSKPALAKKKPPLSEYTVTEPFEWRGETHEGLRYYDLVPGKGPEISSGKKVSVHYDCTYKAIVAVSTRQSVVLSQNRYIEKPYDFKYGVVPEAFKDPLEYKDASGVGIRVDPDPIYSQKLFVTKIYKGSAATESPLKIFDEIISIDGTDVTGLSRREVNDLLDGDKGSAKIIIERTVGKNERAQQTVSVDKRPYKKLVVKRIKSDAPQKAGGLYSGEQLAPPPDILFVPQILKGMKKGGLRRIEVPGDLGYGPEGKNEIPGDETFFMDLELLDILKK